jgi:methylmalonyl-CoA epimerase
MTNNLGKIDHIGIAVKSIDEKLAFYNELLGLVYEGSEEIAAQKVKTAFLKVGESNLELLEPTSPDSAVAKFLESRGEGIHHIALAVNNIEQKIEDLIQKGVRMIDEKPRIGAHNKKIAFIHPKSTGGILLEICEKQ